MISGTLQYNRYTGSTKTTFGKEKVEGAVASMLNASENPDDAGPVKPVRIRDLRKLVSSDPVKPAECVRAISTAASQLLLADLSNDARLKRLSKLRTIIQALNPHLADQMAGPLISSQPGGLPYYDECDRMYSRLADSATCILLSTMENEILSRKQSHQAVQSGYWAMEFLAERLRCAYGVYARLPLGIWFDINRIYRCASERRLQHERIKITKSTTPTCIEHLYKRLIVFGLSDPYQLPFHGIEKVFESLDEWVSMVHLGEKGSENGRLFEINLDTDYPAMPVLGSRKTAETGPVIYLETSRLVGFLKENLINIHNATQNLTIGNRKFNEELRDKEILKKLIVKVGIQPYRNSGRIPGEGTCRAVIGLYSVVDFVEISDEPGVKTRDEAYIRSVDLIDKSEFGARLRIRENGRKQPSVGEVVAFNTGDDVWLVGLVRWVQVDESKQVHVGVHRFLDNYAPVRVRPLASLEEMPFAPPMVPGLWTIRETKGRKLPSLVIAAESYKPKQTVVICRGNIEHALEMRDAILSTDHIVWCNVSLAGSNPQLTMELLHARFARPGRRLV